MKEDLRQLPQGGHEEGKRAEGGEGLTSCVQRTG